MTDATNVRPTLGTAIHALDGKWGWFVALGICELILGGIASANLMAANFASVLVIGAAMMVAGLFQILHAVTVRGLRGIMFWLLGGIVYSVVGAIILYDPLFASLALSLTVGVFLAAAGVMRLWAGFHARPMAGWRWIVAAGMLTFCVDLSVQGWGVIAVGVGLKGRASRHSGQPAAV